MKYIIFDNRVPVIFPKIIDHSEMAKFLIIQTNHLLAKPTSAGFIKDNGVTFGESYTLGLQSGENDDEIIKNFWKD